MNSAAPRKRRNESTSAIDEFPSLEDCPQTMAEATQLFTRDPFTTRLNDCACATEQLLASILSEHAIEGEVRSLARLLAAMRHAALGGGKRLRPYSSSSKAPRCSAYPGKPR